MNKHKLNNLNFQLKLSINFINPKNGLCYLRGKAMERRETILFLREMGECLDSMPISCVFLKNRNYSANSSLDDYELYIKATLNVFTRKVIRQAVKERELRLRESDGFVVIYSPEKELLEITV